MKKSKRGEREPRNYKTINKMAVICSYLFITAINVNGLKCSNKKYGLAECILKHKNNYTRDSLMLKVKRWKKYYLQMEI